MTLHRCHHRAASALTLALCGVTACTKPAVPAKPPVAITVATSELGDAPYIVAANGVVEPLASVAIQSQVGGVLTRVHFEEGDEVRAGQVLFSIDARP